MNVKLSKVIKMANTEHEMETESDIKNFELFAKAFEAKSNQVLKLKEAMQIKRYELFKKAQAKPSFLFSNEFVNSMRIIVQRERRIHLICESGLDRTERLMGEIDPKIEGISKEFYAQVTKIKGLTRYIKKMLERMDRRLKHEEKFLETRDRIHLLDFLKEYQQEIKQDQRLSAEFQEAEIDIDRLRQTVSYEVKRAAGKAAAAAGVIAAMPLAIPVKVLELYFRPLIKMFMSTGQLLWLENLGVKERLKFEMAVSPILEGLIEELEKPEYSLQPKPNLFENLSLPEPR